MVMTTEMMKVTRYGTKEVASDRESVGSNFESAPAIIRIVWHIAQVTTPMIIV
jgi:hypothetical protein